MQWNKIILPASPETIDSICAQLTAMGLESFQIEDERDLNDISPYWDMADNSLFEYYKNVCRIVIYLPASPEGLKTINSLKTLYKHILLSTIAEEDWAENWKKYYKPIFIGTSLVIHPAWEPLGDYNGLAVFINNPGMSFGTGLHASTHMCLEMLEQMDLSGLKILDIGCGSGILSICALLMNAQEAYAVDIDPMATGIASENALNNGVYLKTFTGNLIQDSALRTAVGTNSDIVISNIVADVIIELTPYINSLLNQNGTWISSGIIDTKHNNVIDAMVNNGFHIVSETIKQGWVTISCRKV